MKHILSIAGSKELLLSLLVSKFLGAWSKSSPQSRCMLIKRLAALSGRSRLRYFFQHLSIALQRCNGGAMIRRAPDARLCWDGIEG